MKLLLNNNKIANCSLFVDIDLESGKIKTDDGVAIISESDNYEVLEIDQDTVNMIQSYVENVKQTELMNEHFEIVDGEVQKTLQTLMIDVRKLRDSLLEQSDKNSAMGLPDIWNSITEELRQEWIDYRQELRDITNSIDKEAALEFLERQLSQPISPFAAINQEPDMSQDSSV